MKGFIYFQFYFLVKVTCIDISMESMSRENDQDTLKVIPRGIAKAVSRPEFVISEVPNLSPIRTQVEFSGATKDEAEYEEYEDDLPTEKPTPTPYMEEFTKNNHTSIQTTTKKTQWKYEGNQASEESAESKTSLINYPFSVSVQRKGSHYATGAIISKSWVISAAGVFYHVRESLKLFRIRLGSVNCKKGGIIIPIKKIDIHPYYLYKKPNFDVCMLRLAYKVNFTSYIRPIAISSIKGTVLSAKFMSTYWPRIVYEAGPLPTTAMERQEQSSMRVSTQRLIPSANCTETIKSVNEVLHESSLCLKPIVGHHGICRPDAGAPIIAEDGLWGVTSGWVSKLCPDYPAPTIFTRLASESVRSWLDMQLLGPS